MDSRDRERQMLERITALLRKKQSVLRKTIEKEMEDTILRIIQIHAE
jgi:hypothetical protein